MPRFFDVVPERQKKEYSGSIPSRSLKPQPHFENGPKQGRFLEFLFFFFLIIFAAFAVYYFWEPSAKITIYPEIKPLSKDVDLKAYKNFTEEASLENSTLNLIEIKDDQEYSRSFPATQMEINDKSVGIMRVFNETDKPQNFIVGTQFMQEDGKIFVAKQKIAVPPKRMEGSKEVPGTIDIEVEAAQPGEEYNINPAYFSIPKLKSTELFTKVYGRTFKPTTGGKVGQGYKVTRENLENAQEFLSKEGLEKSQKMLGEKYNQNIVFENSITQQIVSTSTQEKSQESENFFTYSIKVRTTALAVKKVDVESFALKVAQSLLSPNEKLLEKSFKYQITSSGADIGKGQGALHLSISASSLYLFEKNVIAKQVAGRSNLDAQDIIDELFPGQIKRLEVKITPPIKQNLPSDPQKIQVSLEGVD